MSKKAMIVRIGAYGDMLIISPVVDHLFKQGYDVILYTGKRGKEVYKHDPRIKEFVNHDEATPISKLDDVIEQARTKIKPDLIFNLTASIEQDLALHPSQPEYVYPKQERADLCNKNYYEHTVEKCKIDHLSLASNQLRPSIAFSQEELKKAKETMKEDMFNVVWALSGSGRNKVWPWAEYVWNELVKKHPDVHVITIGDERCQILEDFTSSLPQENVTMLSGKINIRESFALTSVCDLVISPDTGVLHASGCFETPKVGLLGHTTKENITKHFLNDFSLEADCECAPCFYLIYDHNIQCPVEQISGSAWCMGVGLQAERVLKHIDSVIVELKKKRKAVELVASSD